MKTVIITLLCLFLLGCGRPIEDFKCREGQVVQHKLGQKCVVLSLRTSANDYCAYSVRYADGKSKYVYEFELEPLAENE